MRAPLHVVAGILNDDQGRVLIAQRKAGTHMAGFWEFPGGKLEPGETELAALRREWREELDIEIDAAEPLWTVLWRYPERDILLAAWRILARRGAPRAREAQALRWVGADELDALTLAPADRPIHSALRLPRLLAITPEPGTGKAAHAWVAQTQRSTDDTQRLTLVRAKQCSTATLTELLAPCSTLQRARLVLHGDAVLAQALGCAGVHLSAAQARAYSSRPLPHSFLLGVSCHDAEELAHATRLDAGYVLLGPVRATTSHPQASPLGWTRFRALARTSAVPVFALGGVGPTDLVEARAHGAFGVAGISSFWPAAG